LKDLSSFIEHLKSERDRPEEIVSHRFIHARKPGYGDVLLDARLRELLEAGGIERLYSHQAEAIGLIREGHNVVVMTPTASGKSLIYNIPILEEVLRNPASKALYISPLKGLEQDQVAALNRMAESLMLPGGAVYDGDTSQYRRKKIRDNPPAVVFTNPDMVHLAINAFHQKWESFFRNLKFVIVDEIHAYRGVFGSNVAQVLRRLRRVASRWGARPQFIACSATIANPVELAERLTGLPFQTVERSGAPSGGKHFLFINPSFESPYTEAVRLFTTCLNEGMRTIVFTKSRKITELVYYWTIQRAPHLEKLISPYRAGFLPTERREIERALFSGELLGVVSTSALELGVDIGGLDVCILLGYPGSVSSTWQRAGRVGRQGQESMVALIGQNDALDQYLMRHPEEFFGKPIESVVIDEENEFIVKNHLPCAAAEVYLRPDDPVYDFEKIKPHIDALASEGKLNPGGEKDIWFSAERMPQRHVGIRAIGEQFAIATEEGRIGEAGGLRLYRETFPGAVYLHRGRQYKVLEIDYEARKVLCRETDVEYYTRALAEEEAEILSEMPGKYETQLFSLHKGSVRLTHRVTGYEKRGLHDGRRFSTHPVEMPEYVFNTKGVWLKIAGGLSDELEEIDLGGSLHAFEHAAISAMPLFTLSDKMDIGGISYPLYPPLGQSAIFFYDGYEGGIGLTWKPFEMVEKWFSTTLKIMKECPCEEGCPSCVQDPQCGNANRPLSKAGAIRLAERLLGIV
jgi:DEAD/DEAH box helicase domain-containing protein